MTKTMMTSAEVKREFKAMWAASIRREPRLKTDTPAKREAFSAYIDGLHRDGRITDRVVQTVDID
jgi:hypothetical protein